MTPQFESWSTTNGNRISPNSIGPQQGDNSPIIFAKLPMQTPTLTEDFMIQLWQPVAAARFKREKVAANRAVAAFLRELSPDAMEAFLEPLMQLSLDQTMGDQTKRQSEFVPLEHEALRPTLLAMLRNNLPIWQTAPNWLVRTLCLILVPGVKAICNEVLPDYFRNTWRMEELLEKAHSQFPNHFGLAVLLVREYARGSNDSSYRLIDWDFGGHVKKQNLPPDLGPGFVTDAHRIQKLRQLVSQPIFAHWGERDRYFESSLSDEFDIHISLEYLAADYQGAFLEWLQDVKGFSDYLEFKYSQRRHFPELK